MSEENKRKEEVKEIDPVDEYLKNYKEHKLAEFCVYKDREIKNLRKENHEFAEQLVKARRKTEEYDKVFESVNNLYCKIKEMSVNDYLKLYHMMSEDVSGYCKTYNQSVSAISNW